MENMNVGLLFFNDNALGKNGVTTFAQFDVPVKGENGNIGG